MRSLSLSNVFSLSSGARPDPNILTLRVKLPGATTASYAHAENPYNKDLVTMFQVDDSAKTIFNLMYPYFRGGTTAGGYVSSGVKSTDGCGNDIYWNASVACFIESVLDVDLLEDPSAYVSWTELATICANGSGLQRGFDFDNHQFGGNAVLQKDRYKQIYLNNKRCFDKLGFCPESIVVPDTQIGYRFSGNDLGMDVTSQAGVEPLKDGVQPINRDAYTEDIYAAVTSPYFISRNHWQETNSAALVTEHQAYMLAAYNKSQIKPCIYNWFSHGPGEVATNNFQYYRDVIDYLKTIAGDKVIGMSMSQFLGYQKTRYAAENGALTSASLNGDYYEIKIDISNIQNTVRHRLISILLTSDVEIDSIEHGSTIKAVTYNASTGLINIMPKDPRPVNPALWPVRPTIIAGTPTIPALTPNLILFAVDRAITQSEFDAYEVAGNTVVGITEVPDSDGLLWEIECANDFLAVDTVTMTYKPELGNAVDAATGLKMLTYSGLPVLNLSEEVAPPDPSLAISIRNNVGAQIYTADTIAEIVTYMSTLNINTDISIEFNNAATYAISTRWTINYGYTAYKITIKKKAGLVGTPVINASGALSDLIRISRSNVAFENLAFESHKYTVDTGGDNYSGAILSQTASTNNVTYEGITLSYGMKGIRVGGPNAGTDPAIHTVVLNNIVVTKLTGAALQIGVQDVNSTAIDSRVDATYGMHTVTVGVVSINDDLAGADIEASGAKFNGQMLFTGVRNLMINGPVVSNLAGTQAMVATACKFGAPINRVSLTNYSTREPSGFKSGMYLVSCIDISIVNCFIRSASYQSMHVSTGRNVSLYYNTFAGYGQGARLQNVRNISEMRGNLFLGGSNNYALEVSFDRVNAYIPELATDYIVEEQNTFYSASGDFRLINVSGIGAGNTSFQVNSQYSNLFPSYQSTYSRGATSQGGQFSGLAWDADDKHLGASCTARNFVATAITGITIDIDGLTRGIPSDCGAYDKDAV